MKNIFKIELNPSRIYGLDILRAFAILFVVAGHGGNIMPVARYKYVNYFIFDGVSIFFVLSGFLIGIILIKLLKRNKISLKLILSFWLRRWFRTLPNYFLILVVLIIISSIYSDSFNFLNHLEYFIFSQNLFSVHPNFFPEAWSLSIEEWFYLLIPIIIIVLIKLFKTSTNLSIIITACSIILFVTLFRFFRYLSITIDDISIWDLTLRKQVVTRLDSIMYGIIGAYISYHFHKFWYKYRILFFAMGILLFLNIKLNLFNYERFGLYHCVLSFSVTSLATLLILPYLSTLNKGKGIIYKVLSVISIISYSMYLINLTLVQKWIIGNIDWTLLENFNGYVYLIIKYLLFWFLTIFISILIYKYFELPVMNLRDKIKFK